MPQEKSPEDEAFDAITQSQQMKESGGETIRYRDAFPKDYILPVDRNAVLEEVAEEIEKFHPAFGQDTVYSFSAFVRGMKK